MIKNYIKIALRNLKNNKNYSLVNITGLAIALACCVLIILYIDHELSYDRFHKNSNRIYRAVKDIRASANRSAITPNPLGPSLKENFPEVENMVRVYGGGPDNKTVSVGDKSFFEKNFYFTDPSFFDVFSFPLLKGNIETALSDPWSVVITEQASHKYFGDEKALGKTLLYENEHAFQVTGILEDIPDNSHFKSNFFASINCTPYLYRGDFLEDWTQSSVHTYVLLKTGTDSKKFENKIGAYLKTELTLQYEEGYSDETKISLQPLIRIHLHSHYFAEFEKNSDIRVVYFYSLIGVLILLIAGVNFMNITTARASTRTTEVGMRKVIGAERSQLIGQFLSESVILSFVSLCVALALAQLYIPWFGNLLGMEFSFRSLLSLPLLSGIIGMTLMVGLLSGSYPAFFLSSFSPVKVLRGGFGNNKKGLRLRTLLVTFQFICSIILIICTLVISRQVRFLKNKDLGFNKDNVLAVHVSDKDKALKAQYEALKNELLKNPDIRGVTSTSNLPHRNHAAKRLPVGEPGEGKFIQLNFMRVDCDFLNTLDAEMAQGRFFSKQIPSDRDSFVVNEAAAEKFEIEDPSGKNIPWIRGNRPVIGVIKNFHFKSLHSRIQPLVLYLQKGGNIDHILIKIQKGKIRDSISFIENTFHRFSPGRALNYFFIDEDIERMYRAENKFMRVFGYFTFLAIFIAFLGLFGLSAFSVQRRTKEISIRKVLGASVFNIMTLLSTNFLKLMLVANLFAWPLSYYFMRQWLSRFAYRRDLGILVFVGASCFTGVIGLLTLGFQALKAAKTDPVENLKYE